MDTWPSISELAATQFGRVSTQQLRAAGIDAAMLSRLVADKGWQRPQRGVYAPVGAYPGPEAMLAEALLVVGPPVLVGGWSAAWLWGLVRSAPTPVELIVPHERKAGRTADIDVRRSRTLVPSDGLVHRGMPVCTVARTLCDLAAVTNEAALRGLLIDARQRRLVDLVAVAQRADGMGTAKGLRLLRQLLIELDAERSDSVLEHKLRARLAGVWGLPPPATAPVPVDVGTRVLHVDIGWPQYRVGIEADGFASHSQRASLDMDARRHNALQLAGWQVLRATWVHLGDDFEQLVRQLRQLLR